MRTEVYCSDFRFDDAGQGMIGRHGKMVALRTLDAIQLAACQAQRDNDVLFVSADDQLCGVCRLENLTFLNPKKP